MQQLSHGGGFGARAACPGEIDVVAIGASAGGIPALRSILRTLPLDLPAAFVIVQHRSPLHLTGLVDVLACTTSMPVVEPSDRDVLAASTVYVAPADTHLTIAGNQLFLSGGPRVQYSRPSIDVLFSSVARARDCRAIAVALTCSNEDGAAGAAEIHHDGGRVIVQGVAEYPRLATAILRSLVPHAHVRLGEISGEIVDLFHGERLRSAP